jgi:hypothetical protein
MKRVVHVGDGLKSGGLFIEGSSAKETADRKLRPL